MRTIAQIESELEEKEFELQGLEWEIDDLRAEIETIKQNGGGSHLENLRCAVERLKDTSISAAYGMKPHEAFERACELMIDAIG